MTYGIEIRDAANNLILSSTGRLFRFILEGAFPSIAARGSLNVAIGGLVQDGSYFCYTSVGDIIGVVTNGNVLLINTNWITPNSGTLYVCAT